MAMEWGRDSVCPPTSTPWRSSSWPAGGRGPEVFQQVLPEFQPGPGQLYLCPVPGCPTGPGLL